MRDQTILPKILVYQDEDCSIMVEYLRFYDFNVTVSTDEDVMQKINENSYDLYILSHWKTNTCGDLKLLTALRKINTKAPAIIVSKLWQYEHILNAFDAGADDYIIRPYNAEELIRRIKAVLKRCGIKARIADSVYQIGKYTFDTKADILTVDNTEIKLTNKESRILALLCAYRDELLPRKILMQHVWADDNYFNKRSLDVYMHKLRSHFRADKRISIETQRGFGYSLTVRG